MNEVIQFIEIFHQNHWIIFWLIAIFGFPEAELLALLAIAIGFIGH